MAGKRQTFWPLWVILALLVLAVIAWEGASIQYQRIEITNEQYPGDERGFSLGTEACYVGLQYGVFRQVVHAEWFAFCAEEVHQMERLKALKCPDQYFILKTEENY